MKKATAKKFDALEWYDIETCRAADDCFAQLMRCGGGCLYLWHKRGGLTFSEEKPGGEWELTHAVPERGARTRDQLRAWVYQIARGVSCLPDVA